MSATSLPSSRPECVELVEFAKAAEAQWAQGAGRALREAAAQDLDFSPASMLAWMGYFQEHCLKGSPRAIEILREFRHHYTALLLTR